MRRAHFQPRKRNESLWLMVRHRFRLSCVRMPTMQQVRLAFLRACSQRANERWNS